MPAPPPPPRGEDLVPPAQLSARHATVRNEQGEVFQPHTWSEIDVVQWPARQPTARAWYAVPRAALAERVRDRTVGEMVDAAERAGAPVERRRDGAVVQVAAAI